MIECRPGDAYAFRFSESLKPCADVHRIAEDVTARVDYITVMDP